MKCLVKTQAFETICISFSCSYQKRSDGDNYQPLCSSNTCFIHSKTTESLDNSAIVCTLRLFSRHTERLRDEMIGIRFTELQTDFSTHSDKHQSCIGNFPGGGWGINWLQRELDRYSLPRKYNGAAPLQANTTCTLHYIGHSYL